MIQFVQLQCLPQTDLFVVQVEDTGKAISVPVGDATLGRVFNVLGDAIDLDGEVMPMYVVINSPSSTCIRRIIY